jgi:hypothetical protein
MLKLTRRIRVPVPAGRVAMPSAAGYGPGVTDDQRGRCEQADLREALKRVAVALKETGIPFALAGGYAVWARGGPEPDHDVDFLVSPNDADKVADLLAGKDLEVQQPPEDWLFKVYTDGAMVDVLHRAAGAHSTEPALEAATELQVLSVRMPVLAATDLVVHKLAVLDERYCDLAQVLPTLRALREQVDWDRVRRQTAGNPFAEVTLVLVDRLGITGT